MTEGAAPRRPGYTEDDGEPCRSQSPACAAGSPGVLTGASAFWRPWATLEEAEELLRATHPIHCDM